MAGARTDLLLKAKVEGVEEARTKGAKFNETMTKGASTQNKAFAALEKTLGRIGKGFGGLDKSLKGTLKLLNEQAKAAQKTAEALEKLSEAQKKTSQHRGREGAFGQGLLMGMIPGAQYIDRGPGKMRQAAGMAIGGGARNIVSNLVGSMASGRGGIVGAAGTFGSMLSGPIERQLAAADQALAFQKNQLALQPYMGGFGVTAGLGRRIQGRQGRQGLGDADVQRERMQASAAARAAFHADLSTPEGRARLAGQQVAVAGRRSEFEKKSIRYVASRAMADPTNPAYARRVEKMEAAAGDRAGAARAQEMMGQRSAISRQVHREAMGELRQSGRQYSGMSLQESQSFAGDIARSAGGTANDLNKQRMLRQSFASNTVYGTSAQTLGGFMSGGRVGGMVGGGDTQSGGDALRKATADAVRVGLEGSEVADYLQNMAQGMNSWKETGLPINAKSIGEMSKTLGFGGALGGQRGSIAAMSMQKGVQAIAEHGPQNAYQAMAVQELGGYKGGGMAEYEKAEDKMLGGGYTDEDLRRLLQKGMRGAGGNEVEERRIIKQVMASIGVTNIQGSEDLRGLQSFAKGSQDPVLKDRIDKLRGIEKAGAEAANIRTEFTAQDRVKGTGMRTGASLADKQIALGNKSMASSQNLEAAAGAFAAAIQNVLGSTLDKLAEAVKGASQWSERHTAPPHPVRPTGGRH